MKTRVALMFAACMTSTQPTWGNVPDLTMKFIDGFPIAISAHSLACSVSGQHKRTSLTANPLRDLIESGKIKHHDLNALGCD
jgi:hypothetical protein